MCYIISVSKQQQSKPKQGGSMREIKITKAGYLYINGKKASPRRITPLYVGADILDPDELEITRKWANAHYKMVNN